jgi:hypothetical protein
MYTSVCVLDDCRQRFDWRNRFLPRLAPIIDFGEYLCTTCSLEIKFISNPLNHSSPTTCLFIYKYSVYYSFIISSFLKEPPVLQEIHHNMHRMTAKNPHFILALKFVLFSWHSLFSRGQRWTALGEPGCSGQIQGWQHSGGFPRGLSQQGPGKKKNI